MELAIGALGSLFSGAGLAGTAGAVASTAGAVGGAAAATSGVLTALQGVSAVLGVLGKIGAGRAEANQATQQANEAELDAGQQQLAGQQRENKMRSSLSRVLGQNDVTYAAAGIDLTQGVAADNAARQKQQSAEDISIDAQQTDLQRSLYKMRAQGLRDKASSARGGALLGALGSAANFGIQLAERG